MDQSVPVRNLDDEDTENKVIIHQDTDNDCIRPEFSQPSMNSQNVDSFRDLNHLTRVFTFEQTLAPQSNQFLLDQAPPNENNRPKNYLSRFLFCFPEEDGATAWQFIHPRIQDYTPHVLHRNSDPQWVKHLQPSISNYWYSTERYTAPRFDIQSDISPRHRTLLINWLVQIQQEWALRDETLHLTINILDRVLSNVHFPRARLQLLGCAALFLACKFEEVSVPKASSYVFLCLESFDGPELIRMERTIFHLCEYNLSIPYSIDFANYYLNSLFLDTSTILYVYYILDRLLLEPEVLANFTPSQQAISAIIYSLHFYCNFELLDAFIQQQTVAYPHTTASLVQCIYYIWELLTNALSNENEFYRKYSNPSYCEVSQAPYQHCLHPDNYQPHQYIDSHQLEPYTVYLPSSTHHPTFVRRTNAEFNALLHIHRRFEHEHTLPHNTEHSTQISLNALIFLLQPLPSNLTAQRHEALNQYYTPPPQLPPPQFAPNEQGRNSQRQSQSQMFTPTSHANTVPSNSTSQHNSQPHQQQQQQKQTQQQDNEFNILDANQLVQLDSTARLNNAPNVANVINHSINSSSNLSNHHILRPNAHPQQSHQFVSSINQPMPPSSTISSRQLLSRAFPQTHFLHQLQQQQQHRNVLTTNFDTQSAPLPRKSQSPHDSNTSSKSGDGDDEEEQPKRRPNLRKK